MLLSHLTTTLGHRVACLRCFQRIKTFFFFLFFDPFLLSLQAYQGVRDVRALFLNCFLLTYFPSLFYIYKQEVRDGIVYSAPLEIPLNVPMGTQIGGYCRISWRADLFLLLPRVVSESFRQFNMLWSQKQGGTYTAYGIVRDHLLLTTIHAIEQTNAECWL
jgi:hypothetical protein